jgi:hypothetical protein
MASKDKGRNCLFALLQRPLVGRVVLRAIEATEELALRSQPLFLAASRLDPDLPANVSAAVARHLPSP